MKGIKHVVRGGAPVTLKRSKWHVYQVPVLDRDGGLSVMEFSTKKAAQKFIADTQRARRERLRAMRGAKRKAAK